jgi:hypothetical protein
MKESKLSLLLTVALICGTGKLDLSCPSFGAAAEPKAPLVGFEPLDPRNAHQAYVIRYGKGKMNDVEPRWSVQLGHAVRQALFWAAVASVLL